MCPTQSLCETWSCGIYFNSGAEWVEASQFLEMRVRTLLRYETLLTWHEIHNGYMTRSGRTEESGYEMQQYRRVSKNLPPKMAFISQQRVTIVSSRIWQVYQDLMAYLEPRVSSVRLEKPWVHECIAKPQTNNMIPNGSFQVLTDFPLATSAVCRRGLNARRCRAPRASRRCC